MTNNTVIGQCLRISIKRGLRAFLRRLLIVEGVVGCATPGRESFFVCRNFSYLFGTIMATVSEIRNFSATLNGSLAALGPLKLKLL